MGTSIELTVGGLSLSYSKNMMGLDFGFLFQDRDATRRAIDGIDYDYYRKHPELDADLAEHESVFARSLSSVLPRLNLLGATIESARGEYEAVVAKALEMASYDDPPGRANFR